MPHWGGPSNAAAAGLGLAGCPPTTGPRDDGDHRPRGAKRQLCTVPRNPRFDLTFGYTAAQACFDSKEPNRGCREEKGGVAGQAGQTSLGWLVVPIRCATTSSPFGGLFSARYGMDTVQCYRHPQLFQPVPPPESLGHRHHPPSRVPAPSSPSHRPAIGQPSTSAPGVIMTRPCRSDLRNETRPASHALFATPMDDTRGCVDGELADEWGWKSWGRGRGWMG